MAVHAPIMGERCRARPFLDFQPVRHGRFRRLVAVLSRDEIGRAIDALIAVLDARSGDPDLEEQGLEDSFIAHRSDGPGCPIGDGAEDVAWIEWGTRGRHKDDRGAEPLARERHRQALREDDEDDDPAEDDDSDRCMAGDDHMVAGPVAQREWWTGDDALTDVEQEQRQPPAYMIDQTRLLFVTAANDWAGA